MPRKSQSNPVPDYIESSLHGQLVRVDDLCSDPNNVRLHNARNLESIRKSLGKFKQQKPIVISEDGIVLAGNGTLAAARALGWEWIAAAKSSLTGKAAKAFAIADNRTNDLSAWNKGDLAEQLQDLEQDLEFDHTSTGFDSDEIQSLLAELEIGGPGGDEEQEEQKDEPTNFGVLVTCKNSREQKRTIKMLEEKGYTCTAMSM